MKQEIERVIAELIDARVDPQVNDPWDKGWNNALRLAQKKLEAVIANGTNDGSGVSRNDQQEAEQVPSQENNR